ncbi:putative nitrate/sulfonate/bicarbonate ABC transporter, permease protein [Rhizobium etli CNPAF512]|nr:putative nitrate/sulfonate/bicarbonate ABC transporter, permease protein [Rhizobium etli CNPAF512]
MNETGNGVSRSPGRIPARDAQAAIGRHALGFEGLFQRNRRTFGHVAHRRKRRIRQPPRPVRLRQVDGAAHHRRPRRRDIGGDRLAEFAHQFERPAGGRHRLRLPGADADALEERIRQCPLAAEAEGCFESRSLRADHGCTDDGRSAGFRQGLSARTFRRHEDAGLDRPRAGDETEASADGRALRRTRRNHPPEAQRRRAAALEDDRHYRHLRHSFRLRVGLSLEPHRGDEGKARPRPRRCPANDQPGARCLLPQFRRIQEGLRDGLPFAHRRNQFGGRSLMSDETDASPHPDAAGARRRDLALRIAVPMLVIALLVLIWYAYVKLSGVPSYILPGPAAVANAFVTDWATLAPAFWVTTKITFLSLMLALVGGVGFAIFLVQSRWIELAFYPLAVILQVTPIVAISPLILIYAPSTQVALLICAFLVAFFPILSNMVQGLKSVDHNLINLFELYGASRWQTLLYLKLPAAQPYFMTGLRIGGGLALIAAVVAEFAAGSAGAGSGLAFRLLEAQYRLNIPRLFAALLMLSLLGVAIFALTSFISWLALHRWHESSLKREN